MFFAPLCGGLSLWVGVAYQPHTPLARAPSSCPVQDPAVRIFFCFRGDTERRPASVGNCGRGARLPTLPQGDRDGRLSVRGRWISRSTLKPGPGGTGGQGK